MSETDRHKGGKGKKNQERLSLEQRTGLTKRRVNEAIAELGMDAAQDYADSKRLKEIGAAEKMIHDAEAAKVRLDVERATLAKIKGDLIEKADVKEQGIRLAAIVSAELASLCDDMPGELEGMDAAQIRQRLIERTERAKVNVKQELSKC